MSKKRAVPDVRFKGFEGEWEERKLLETIDKIIDFRGRTPKKLGFKWSNDGYLALSALNVKDGYIDTAVDAHYGDQDLYEAWMKGNDLHVGQVLFTTEAPMGNVAQVPDDKKYILSQRVIAFNVDQQIIAENLLAVILRVPEVHTRLCSLASGGTAKGVSQRSLAEVKFLIPEYPTEQTRIGELFRNLDARITLQQRKHEKLQNIKKSMLEKMFPKPGAAVPEVRFQGFEREWETEKLPEIFTYIPNNTLSRACLNYSGGLAKNIHYGDILIKYAELLDVQKHVIPYISNDRDANKLKLSALQDGDIIIADAAEDETVGKCTEIINIGNETIVSGLHTIPCRPKLFFSSGYLGYFMNSYSYRKQLMHLMQGTKVKSLSKSALHNTVIFYPSDKHNEEQTRIGEFFRNLDSLISLQQRKCEKLHNIKKAMLGKMFV